MAVRRPSRAGTSAGADPAGTGAGATAEPAAAGTRRKPVRPRSAARWRTAGTAAPPPGRAVAAAAAAGTADPTVAAGTADPTVAAGTGDPTVAAGTGRGTGTSPPGGWAGRTWCSLQGAVGGTSTDAAERAARDRDRDGDVEALAEQVGPDHADDLLLRVDQRPARVSGVDRRVELEVCLAGIARDVRAQRADQAAGHRLLVPRGRADRDHRRAGYHGRGGRRDPRELLRGVQPCQVAFRVDPHHLDGEALVVMLDGGGTLTALPHAFDHVVVGQQVGAGGRGADRECGRGPL